ncbi:MAG TPA: ABC transporter ATP-binding protein [Candidatus Babeliales bacterium]|nr:ABC transporter ATP-binding protein [Candidatus Babeliales bacterium]
MSSPLLQIRNVSKTFQVKKNIVQALTDISLDIERGEVLGLLGPNGAGKTTLSNIIATLNPPTSGEILMDGKSIYQDIVQYRNMLGYCPQHPNLNANFTLRENLEFDGLLFGLSKQEIKDKLDQVVEMFKLEKYLEFNSMQISGGYLRRFGIARALMHNPKFVILDEPTVGLDPHIRRQVWKCIQMLKKEGITVILTTHYLDEAELLSDRICFLDKGKLLFVDTPQALKEKHGNKSLEDVFVQLFEEE